jgi:adenosylmethionine-8-amino-7-oxononanoate aminotransferase
MGIARACGALCIADEVMTGFGRTGTFLATQQCSEAADLVCLSKGITGGFMPLGATLCSGAVHAAFEQGTGNLERMFLHGHSYTGNPLACAAALASLTLTLSQQTETALARINATHRAFIAEWLPHAPTGTTARICGTILAIEYPATTGGGYADGLRQRMYSHHMRNGILLRPLGNVCYVLPPYCITGAELLAVYQSIMEFDPSN